MKAHLPRKEIMLQKLLHESEVRRVELEIKMPISAMPGIKLRQLWKSKQELRS
jgi:hypothetical protein